MQRRQLRQALDLPQGIVADQRGVFEAFAAVGDAVANAVDLLQAAQDPAAGQRLQQQGHCLMVIGDGQRLLPFLFRRFQREAGLGQADTFDQPLTEQRPLRHVKQLKLQGGAAGVNRHDFIGH